MHEQRASGSADEQLGALKSPRGSPSHRQIAQDGLFLLDPLPVISENEANPPYPLQRPQPDSKVPGSTGDWADRGELPCVSFGDTCAPNRSAMTERLICFHFAAVCATDGLHSEGRSSLAAWRCDMTTPAIGRVLSIPMISLLFLAHPALAGDVEVTLGVGDGFVVEDNTGAIERLRVDEATGNISRNGALFVHTTGGSANTFVGGGAGNLANTGTGSSAFGSDALSSNTTGNYNTAFGNSALQANTTGQRHTAVGNQALRDNISGIHNTAFGEALTYNTGGSENAAFGNGAMFLTQRATRTPPSDLPPLSRTPRARGTPPSGIALSTATPPGATTQRSVNRRVDSRPLEATTSTSGTSA